MRSIHVVVLAGAVLPASVQAACSKADIQFLLQGGFSVAEARVACGGAATQQPVAAAPAAAVATAPPAPAAAPAPALDRPVVVAQAAPIKKPPEPGQVIVTTTTETSEGTTTTTKQKSSISDFTQGWGIGLAAVRNRGDPVNDASVVNGVVRANAVQSWQPNLLVARHWYFSSAPYATCSVPLWGSCLGVFVALGIGGGAGSSTNQVIDMAGGGLLVGFGAGTKNPQEQAHNVGIGVGRRFNVKMLGEGVTLNAPLPAGETQIRYQTKDITAPFIFYTYKFGST